MKEFSLEELKQADGVYSKDQILYLLRNNPRVDNLRNQIIEFEEAYKIYDEKFVIHDNGTRHVILGIVG